MTNPLIQQANAKIDQSVKPDQKDAYDRIVTAGLKIFYSKEMNAQLLASLNAVPDRVTTTVDGVIGMLGILFKESRNTMPPAPMVLAGQKLLLEVLDFLEQAQMVEVNADTLAKATQHYLNTMMPKIGLTPERMQGLLSKTQGVMADPQKMAHVKQQMGGAQ